MKRYINLYTNNLLEIPNISAIGTPLVKYGCGGKFHNYCGTYWVYRFESYVDGVTDGNMWKCSLRASCGNSSRQSVEPARVDPPPREKSSPALTRWDEMIWYDMIWYDMIWYDMIWYDMIWYDMIWYDMIWYDMIWYDMIWYDMIWYDMIWYDRCDADIRIYPTICGVGIVIIKHSPAHTYTHRYIYLIVVEMFYFWKTQLVGPLTNPMQGEFRVFLVFALSQEV